MTSTHLGGRVIDEESRTKKTKASGIWGGTLPKSGPELPAEGGRIGVDRFRSAGHHFDEMPSSRNPRDLLDSRLAPFETIVGSVLAELERSNAQLRFASSDAYARALEADVARANALLVREILARVYWASSALLQRNWGYLRGLLALHGSQNLMGFCSVLRAFVESAADTAHCMKSVVGGLLANYALMRSAAEEKERGRVLSPADLEEKLLHAVYAVDRRHANEVVAPGEKLPLTHVALSSSEYVTQFGHNAKPLYDQLCKISHPSAFSTSWYWAQVGDTIALRFPDEGAEINSLLETHADCVGLMFTTSLNYPLLALRALRRFPARALQTRSLDSFRWDGTPAFNQLIELERNHR